MLIAEWIDAARCSDMNPALFEPVREQAAPEALAACLDCPVRAECLDDALRLHDDTMVRAGLTPEERRRLRAGRPAAKPRNPGQSLSPETHAQLVELHAQGATSRQISAKLDIPDRTVRYQAAKLDPNYRPAPSRSQLNRNRKLERKTCTHGHLWTPENTRRGKDGVRRCIACQRLRTRAHHIKAGNAREDAKTHCRNGHEKTPENIRITSSGIHQCRPCAHDRHVRSKKKENAHG